MLILFSMFFFLALDAASDKTPNCITASTSGEIIAALSGRSIPQSPLSILKGELRSPVREEGQRVKVKKAPVVPQDWDADEIFEMD